MSKEHNEALLAQLEPSLAQQLADYPSVMNGWLRLGVDTLLDTNRITRHLSPLRVDWVGADKALLQEYLQAGFGILAVHNHPTKMDGPLMARLANRISPFVRGHFAIAHHQFAEHRTMLPLIGRQLGYVPHPIVTPHTQAIMPELPINQGYPDFLKAASWALSNGEYVSVPFDAERTFTVGSAGQATVGLLLRELDTIHTPENYVVLPVGIVPNPETGDYDNGYNWGKPYVLRVGAPLYRPELNEQHTDITLGGHRQRKALYMGINNRVLEDLQKLLQ